MQRHWSIRAHVLTLVLTTMLPLLAVLGWTIASQAQHELQHARVDTVTIAQRTAVQLQQFLDDADRTLSILAQRPQASAVDAQGCDPLLGELGVFHSDFDNIAVVDLSGQVRCVGGVPAAGPSASVGDTRWFQAVVRSPSFVVGEPQRSPITQRWVSVLASPIRDQRGALVGVLALPVDLVRYQRVLNAALLPASRTVTITDADGIVVARSAESERWVGQPLLALAADSAPPEQAEGSAQARGADGIERLYGFATLPEIGWRVAVSQPITVALAPTRAVLERNVVLCLTILLLTGGCAQFLNQRIARPICALASATEAVGAGQLETIVPISGPAEVAGVAQRFNTMTSQRRQAEQALRSGEQQLRAILDSLFSFVGVLSPAGEVLEVNRTALVAAGLRAADVVGKPFDQTAWWSYAPEVQARLRAAIARASQGETVRYNVPLRVADGQLITCDVALAPMYDQQGRLSHLISSAIDISERVQVERQLRALLERTSALAELSYLVTEISLDQRDMIEKLVRRIAELVGDGCALLLLSEDGQVLVPRASYHPNAEARAFLKEVFTSTVQQSDEGLSGLVMQTGEALFIPDLRVARIKALVKPEYWPYIERFGIHSTIVVPLRVRGRALGALTVVRDLQSSAYTHDDLTFVQDLADRVALAITNAQLFRQTQAALQQSDEARALLDTLFDKAPIGLAFHDRELRFQMINARLAAINGLPPDAHLGHTVHETLPEVASRVEPLLREVLTTLQPSVNVEMIGPSRAEPGQQRYWLANFYPVRRSDGQVLGVGTVVVDITEQKRAEESLRQYADQLRHLRGIDQAILALQSPLTMAEATVGHIRQVVPCSRASIVVIDQETQAATLLAVDAERAVHMPAGISFPYGSYIITDELQAGQVMMIDDIQAIERPSPGYRALLADGVRAYLVVPLMAQNTLIGVIAIGNDEPGPLRSEHIALVREIAAHLTIALHNVRLFEQVRNGRERLQTLSKRLVEAQELERRHIARELHDEIGQALTGVKLYLHTVQRAASPAELQTSAADSLRVVEHALQQVRSLSLALRPSMLDDFGLISALRWYIQRQAQLAGFSASVSAEPEDMQLPAEVATTCFRIAQEAMTNVVRHAAAHTVTIEVLRTETELQMTIVDDGVGFDVGRAQEHAVRGESMGLLGMQERAQLLGGSLGLCAAPDQGTHILLRLPLPQLS